MDPQAALTQEYIALRAEITQSIAKQHQILLAGYGLASAIVGYILGADEVNWTGLAVIPIILLAMVCLWAVECNRMVRASYYIAYKLWPRIYGSTEGWETWIRIEEGNAGGFRKRQDILQQAVVAFVPFFLSCAATGIVLIYIWQDVAWRIGMIIFTVFLLIVWLAIYWQIRKISNLGAVVENATGEE